MNRYRFFLYLIKSVMVLAVLLSIHRPSYGGIKLTVYYDNNRCVLVADEKIYPCFVGKNGVIDSQDKREGDKRTPTGTYKIIKAYYRKDRLTKKLIDEINLDKSEIYSWSLWGDDSKNIQTYNRYVDARDYPHQQPNFSTGSLLRKDELYDLFYVIDYNTDKRVPGLGSTIFFTQ